ncbi:DUF2768 domain-containing protein [Gracilibacillus xinjiangensis]|uniref:DUF2768 domain-containing protein n=1 Tax=Gracilibacillus xinjiangensis TaxID=1193282 RepID=A0ABV8WZ14_9BACI
MVYYRLWINYGTYKMVERKDVTIMSASMMMMWVSFAGMIALFLAIGLILLSRYKLKGFFARIVALFAYIFLLAGGLIIAFVVLRGPTS